MAWLLPKHHLAILTLTVGLLASCSGMSTPTASDLHDSNRAKYALTVTLSPGDTGQSLEAKYGGKVVIFNTEAGFAVMGVNSAPDKNDPAVQALEDNQNTVSTPVVAKLPDVMVQPQAEGEASSGSWSAWSGGWGAWSGGWSAWSGGSANSTAPSENAAIWNKIGLATAQSNAPRLGAGIKVAVIDTGIDMYHPAFQNRLSAQGEWWDYWNFDNWPWETSYKSGNGYGHGTNVAGIIAQVAPKATILPLRVLGHEGKGDTLDIAEAINDAANLGAKVINLSLGSSTQSTAITNAIKYALSKGIYVVTSAGNEGKNGPTFPAANGRDTGMENLISVGSTDLNDRKSSFSNYGPSVDLVAPGEKVFAPAPDNRLASWTGTSQAAPMVSGALALMLGEVGYQPRNSYTVWQNLCRTSDPVNDTQFASHMGCGRLHINDFIWWSFH